MQYTQWFKQPLNILLQLSLYALLAACGGGSGGGGPVGGGSSGGGSGSVPDTTAPSAVIEFPPAFSVTESNSVTVRGTASDDGDITVVRVNGVDASSGDGFATWSATIPLVPGDNAITIETGDVALNADASAASAVIQHRARMRQVNRSALDASNNRMLVVDSMLDAIIAVDLDTGARYVLSGPETPDTNNAFADLRGLTVDNGNNRALAVGTVSVGGVSEPAVIAVDLATGARTVLSDNSISSVIDFITPIDIALDPANDRALVLDSGHPAVLSVYLGTGSGFGSRGRFSVNSTPSTPTNVYVNPLSIEVFGSRFYVVDAGRSFGVSVAPRVISAPITTPNAREIFSDSSTPAAPPNFTSPAAIGFYDGQALVTDASGDGVISALLEPSASRARGYRSWFSSNVWPDSNNPLAQPMGIEVMEGADLGWVVNQRTDEILQMDLTTGARTVLADNAVPDNEAPFDDAVDIVIDRANNQAYVLERNIVRRINLLTGERSILSGGGVPDSVNGLVIAQRMVLDSANNRLLVTDSSPGTPLVMAVSLDTGARTLFSAPTFRGDGDALMEPRGIAMDRANNRVLVTDDNLDAVYAIDLDSGDRTLVSSNARPNTLFGLQTPIEIVLNADNTAAYVLDAALNAVIEVDLGTGARTLKTGNASVAGDELRRPQDMILVPDLNQLLLVDLDWDDSVLAVDLASGERTLIEIEAVGALDLAALALDSGSNQVLMMDNFSDALITYDLANGNTVVQSRSFLE